MMPAGLSGAVVCARYALAPNLYRYCGPDTGGDLADYAAAELADRGLAEYLAKFETLYPYLRVIAQANGVNDPLDTRVVEAYWVGNELLERVKEKELYKVLVDCQLLPKRLSPKEAGVIYRKIDQRARLHHSFHVLNVFSKTGWRMRAETVETMDKCRISWGQITDLRFKIHDLRITLKSQELRYREGKLRLVPVSERSDSGAGKAGEKIKA